MHRLDATLDRLVELDARGEDCERSPLWADAERECDGTADMLLRLAAASVQREDARAATDIARYVARAAAASPDDPGVLTRGASLLFHAGAVDEAARLVKRATEHASPDFPLAVELVYLAGRIMAAKGRRDHALDFLTEAFEADPSGLGHGRELARLYAEQGEWKRAQEIASAALAQGCDDAALERLAREIESHLR